MPCERAEEKLRSCDLFFIGVIKKAPEKGLMVFLKMMFAYQSQRSDVPIRGPDGLAWDFYQLNGGGNKLAPFLLGTASQHRN